MNMPKTGTLGKTIAIAGNIGTGKSSLVEFLTRTYGIEPFYEPNDENPYLPDFYQDMNRWAFHSQLYFLSNKFRMHQQSEMTTGVVVLDRTIYEDAEIFDTALHDMGKFTGRDWDTYWNFYPLSRRRR